MGGLPSSLDSRIIPANQRILPINIYLHLENNDLPKLDMFKTISFILLGNDGASYFTACQHSVFPDYSQNHRADLGRR